MVDRAGLIEEMQQAVTNLREQLDDFRNSQDDMSDESNDDKLTQATAGLDVAEGAIGDLVP